MFMAGIQENWRDTDRQMVGRGMKKGRPDKWLYVGGTKAGPAVLWLYPFGGAPNGHMAGL